MPDGRAFRTSSAQAAYAAIEHSGSIHRKPSAHARRSGASCGAGVLLADRLDQVLQLARDVGLMALKVTSHVGILEQLGEVAARDHQVEDIIAVGVLDQLEVALEVGHLALYTGHLLEADAADA